MVFKPDHWLIVWLEKHVVSPTDLKTGWFFGCVSGLRVFAVTLFFYRLAAASKRGGGFIETKEWTWLKIEGPGRGTKLWENGVFHFAVHLPFGLGCHVKLPISYAGERWGYALQMQIGWKTSGNLSATFRVQPDLVQDYNTPTTHWRSRGLKEGWV